MVTRNIRPLEQLRNTINTMKEIATSRIKIQNSFTVILLTYLKIAESRNSEGSQRFPMTGTIEEIGADISGN